jgi:hypothetical protein
MKMSYNKKVRKAYRRDSTKLTMTNKKDNILKLSDKCGNRKEKKKTSFTERGKRIILLFLSETTF